MTPPDSLNRLAQTCERLAITFQPHNPESLMWMEWSQLCRSAARQWGVREKAGAIAAAHYNHAFLNDKPEVASAVKRILEDIRNIPANQ
jgi:hypothetical protein